MGHAEGALPTNHCLYLPKLKHGCYPERNFERNQLLGGSMSLSPLYAAQSKDLHVTRPAGLHQPFDWLHHGHVKITTFRVYIVLLGTPHGMNAMRVSRLNASAFAACLRLPDSLAVQRNSLIRVSRRSSGVRP